MCLVYAYFQVKTRLNIMVFEKMHSDFHTAKH